MNDPQNGGFHFSRSKLNLASSTDRLAVVPLHARADTVVEVGVASL
jgi:hypothetical protein